MKISKRSILVITIAALLSACGNDDSSTSIPEKPHQLKPAPSEVVSLNIAGLDIDAMKESVVITTLEGEEKLSSVEAFKGIRFASADRFEHSSVVSLEEGFNEYVFDATQFGDVCPQLKANPQNLEQSEDCLNLNIWRPEGTMEGEDLPVYVFIHGGDFEYGSGSNPMIHGDTVVAQGADEGNKFITVTFNYRLGLLGSNWVKGENVNGNYGLGDQETLLKWVQANIQNFGGNAGNVTLMGQGAGAMSIALLQQKVADGNLDETYFQRAIMQSIPYGFEYKSYNVAKDQVRDTENLRSASVAKVLETQSTTLNPLQRLENWLLSSLNIPLISPKSDNTPMATLMPYAPYLECKETFLGLCKEGMAQLQPSQTNFVVPTIMGVNAQESDSMSILPNLTSLVPIIIDLMGNDTGDGDYTALRMSEWLAIDTNKLLVKARLQSLVSSDEFNAQLELQDLINALPSSAYETITTLFFGLKNETGSDLIQLTDFYPNDEHNIIGAVKNMSQYRTLMNDTLFSGPARMKAAQNNNSTFYYFAHQPSFNVWTYSTGPNGETDFGDLIKSISCITGACNASELPFVFNKALKLDGTEITPSSKDKQLMNDMSRLWFSDKLFTDYKYDSHQDNVMLIESEIIRTINKWDETSNIGEDPALRNGRLTGLEQEGILLNYMQN